MFVSVIVPMYNAERCLTACLDALVSQDYPSSDYEILLVDNRSTDRSTEIGCSYQHLTLLSEPAPGAYLARNRGIRAARGEILAFTDPDCVPAAS